MTYEGTEPVQASMTTFQILEALYELDGAGVTVLANNLDLPKSTIHRHLQTMLDADYITQEGNEYYVGLQLFQLGEYAKKRRDIYTLAVSHVEELAEETGERSQFVVEEHGRGIYLHVAAGRHAVYTGFETGGEINNFHSTAAGKLFLAFMPEERAQRLINERGLPRQTTKTITDREKLLAELSTVRERGYAFNREENIEGLRTASAPVKVDGKVHGVLSVSGPTNRLKGKYFEREIPDLLLGSTNELELRIEYN